MVGTQFLVLDVVVHIMTIYLLTPWSRVLLEKLTTSQSVKKFPAFYGTRKFITALHVPATCLYPQHVL